MSRAVTDLGFDEVIPPKSYDEESGPSGSASILGQVIDPLLVGQQTTSET
ncbi:hypothetical protein NGM37_62115 [Streptomyces sp. TRM76130]|nr:hypothetical protein [Streptomyces sp. TRM76130]